MVVESPGRVLALKSCRPNALRSVTVSTQSLSSFHEGVTSSYMYWASMISRYLGSINFGSRLVLTGTRRIMRSGKTIFM